MSEGLQMDGVSLPGLRGDRAVGFMGALGVLRLLTEERGHPAVTLAWTPDHSTAVISGGPWETPQDIADELLPVVEGTPEGGVLPGVPVEWPPGRAKRGPDPALPLRRDAREAWRDLLGTPAEKWISGAMSDMPPRTVNPFEAADQPVVRSPYIFPAGKMGVRTFFGSSLAFVRKDPTLIVDALIRGRRVDGCTGEMLDHSAYADPTAPTPWGDPGLTWLATMAMPMLPVTVDRHGALARCWYRYTRRGDKPGTLRMAWPLWSQPLDTHAIIALVEHPWINPCPEPDPLGRWEVDLDTLHRAMNVFAVHGAERRQVSGSKYLWPLAPCPVGPALRLTADESADRLGIARSTWTSYTSPTRGYAPPADGTFDSHPHRPFWYAETVNEFKDDRRGQGARNPA